MRLWSLHPKYLDTKGLVALWREALLAQKVLAGKTKGYRNHPQLDRFKKHKNPPAMIGSYLEGVLEEAQRRGYSFDPSKIENRLKRKTQFFVNSKQRDFELLHLKTKLKIRSPDDFVELKKVKRTQLHPLFKAKPGPIEDWEIQ